MSNAKFLAAKELIQDGDYDAARAILKTIDHPTAHKWLKRVDKLDPPFPENGVSQNSEQEKYYKRENRRARLRNVGDGIYLIIMALFIFGAWLLFSGLLFGQIYSDPYSGVNLLMLVFAVLLFVFGFFRMTKRG